MTVCGHIGNEKNRQWSDCDIPGHEEGCYVCTCAVCGQETRDCREHSTLTFGKPKPCYLNDPAQAGYYLPPTHTVRAYPTRWQWWARVLRAWWCLTQRRPALKYGHGVEPENTPQEGNAAP